MCWGAKPLFIHEAVMDPQEEAEDIALKGTESTGQTLSKGDLTLTTLGVRILNRVILVL